MRETETAIIAEIKNDVKWQKWEEETNAQIASGLTVKEWCRQNNVNEKNKKDVHVLCIKITNLREENSNE